MKNVELKLLRSNVRRDRMGHIELACPVAHILVFKITYQAEYLLAIDMKTQRCGKSFIF